MTAAANKNPNSGPSSPEDDGPLKNLEGKLLIIDNKVGLCYCSLAI